MLRSLTRSAVVLAVLVSGAALGSGVAGAAELGDYLWQRRPLLLFAPTDDDPRLVDTLRGIDASRCDFVEREMVLGVVVDTGTSTLDGQAMDAAAARRLTDRYGVGADSFAAVLIGKDGGQKLRVDDVPDLRTVYAVIDGMPMRAREASAAPRRC